MKFYRPLTEQEIEWITSGRARLTQSISVISAAFQASIEISTALTGVKTEILELQPQATGMDASITEKLLLAERREAQLQATLERKE